MAKKTLRDLLVDELRDLYHADKQLLRALPRLAKGATADEVRKLCEEGVDYTAERLKRLERVFAQLGAPARGKTCHAMAGLIEEAMETLDEDFSAPVRDAALLADVQRISHYGIAVYGTAYAYARALDKAEAAEILAESLREKKEADREVTGLAEGEINRRALAGAEEEDDAAGAGADKAAAGDKPRKRRHKKASAR